MFEERQPTQYTYDNSDLLEIMKGVQDFPISNLEKTPWAVTKANEYAAVCRKLAGMLDAIRHQERCTKNKVKEMSKTLLSMIEHMEDERYSRLDIDTKLAVWWHGKNW